MSEKREPASWVGYEVTKVAVARIQRAVRVDYLRNEEQRYRNDKDDERLKELQLLQRQGKKDHRVQP
jgi:hypothetical protein